MNISLIGTQTSTWLSCSVQSLISGCMNAKHENPMILFSKNSSMKALKVEFNHNAV